MNAPTMSIKRPITRQTAQRARWIPEAKKEKSLLIIEPHPAIAEILVTTLHLFQYDCSIVSSMDLMASLPWDHRHERPPDGILLDVDMRSTAWHRPFDVVEVFGRAWQQAFFAAPMPPLLLLTTQPGEGEALRRAGHRVMMKPFKPSLLMSQIEGAIDQTQQEGARYIDTNG